MKATQLARPRPEPLARQHHARPAGQRHAKRYIDELSVTGLTSNPTIFDHAIKNSTAYDAAIREKLDERASRARRSSSSWRSTTSPGPPTCSGRSTIGPTAWTAGCRWKSRRCWPTTRPSTLAAAKDLHARAARPNLFIKIPGTKEGLPAIEEAIFAGVPINVTLLFSREQYVAAAEAYLRGIERRIAAGLNPNVGSVASVFISRWDVAVAGKVPEALREPARHRHRQAHLQGLPRPARLAALAAHLQRRRASATPAVGQHRNQGSEGLRHPLHQGAGRAVHREHDARGHAEGLRRSRRGRRRSCRPTAATARRCWREFAKAGIDVDALAAQLQDEGASVVREIVERPDGGHRVQERQPSTQARDPGGTMNVLVVDVGGTHVKILATGQSTARKFVSGPELT